MGDRSSNHASIFPDLHTLLNYSIPYHHSSWNLRRNPALLAHEISAQQSPSNLSPASSATVPDTRSNPRNQNKINTIVGLIKFASGTAAATAGAPIERVHILMQCQNEMIRYGRLSSPYKGMTDCLLRTIKHEGVLSLWRGNSLNVLSSLISMVIYPLSLPIWREPISLMYSFHIHYPLQHARVRLACDVKAAQGLHLFMDSSVRSVSNDGVGDRKFSGVFDVFNKTLKSEGVIGLYRGYIPFGCGIVATYLYSKWITSVTKQNKMTVRLSQEKHKWLESEKIIPVAMTLVGFSVIRYPFRTVSRRMVINSGKNIKYKGMVDAIHQIVKHEGVSSLYKGVTPYIIYLSISSLAYYYSAQLVVKEIKSALS